MAKKMAKKIIKKKTEMSDVKNAPLLSKENMEKYLNILKNKLNEINPVRAIVYYFDDRVSRNFIPYDLFTNEKIFHLPNSELAFILQTPTIYRRGIPIYWCVRVQEQCLSFNIVFDKKNNELIMSENYLDPAESYAVQTSNARTSILKKEKLSFTQSVITLLLCVITGLFVYLCCIPFMS